MPSRPVKLPPSAIVPRCAYCGRPHRLSTWTHSQPIGHAAPKVGDKITVGSKTEIIVQAVSATWTDPEVMTYRKQHTVVWDGQFRMPYGRFERLRCAQEFANAAYDAGYRIKKG